MIYEKKLTHVNIKRDDMPYEDVNPGHYLAVSGIEPRRDADVCNLQNADVIKAYRPAHKKAKGIIVFAAVLFCVMTVDVRLLGGRLAQNFRYAVNDGIKHLVEIAEPKDVHEKSTLYTRLLCDVSENLGIKEPDAVSNDVVNDEETVAPVSNNVADSFVDGTRFYPIVSLDLSADSLFSLSNGTSFSPDMERLSSTKPTALTDVAAGEGPLVLIVHTHGEECYAENADMYPEGDASRSGDTQKNVVRVGKEIADTLADFGIETLHCETMHDSESFINAYSASAKSVSKYLEEYPSVKIVVDVHRDAIIRDSGESVKAVTEIAGQDYAQLMFVVGTNELGHNHPDWQDNLSLAMTLQKSMNDTYPSLCRSINLRNVPFNQQLSSGYLLLEVGTCANTLDEALRSARAFGENLARTIITA